MTLQELMDRNYEQGLEQGRAEGEALGRDAAILELARTMKENGRPPVQIIQDTGLSADEVDNL